MLSLTKLTSFAAALSMIDARKASNHDGGLIAEYQEIEQNSGRVSMQLAAESRSFNKMGQFVSSPTFRKDELSFANQLYSVLYGKSEMRNKIESRAAKKLGQGQSGSALQHQEGYVWTG